MLRSILGGSNNAGAVKRLGTMPVQIVKSLIQQNATMATRKPPHDPIPPRAPKMWTRIFEKSKPINFADHTIVSKPHPDARERRRHGYGKTNRRAKPKYPKGSKPPEPSNKPLWTENTICRYTGSVSASDYLNRPVNVPYRYHATEEDLAGAPEQVKQIFSWQNASQEELNKKAIQEAIQRFQRKPGDTGSTEVQIAVLTEKIKYLTAHMTKHRQDKHNARALEILVNKRKKLLKYLKKHKFDTYWATIRALDIRTIIV